MFHVVLFEPEIPGNTGNIIRLCANTGAHLHLIQPLGFSLAHSLVKRAGLDYHELACVQVHANYDAFLQNIRPKRVFALTTKARHCYTTISFSSEDALLFGPETRGLPSEVLTHFEATSLRIPMQAQSRSLNLSNAVAVVLYEAYRQLQFPNFQR